MVSDLASTKFNTLGIVSSELELYSQKEGKKGGCGVFLEFPAEVVVTIESEVMNEAEELEEDE